MQEALDEAGLTVEEIMSRFTMFNADRMQKEQTFGQEEK
jgi:hypothetical protein